MDSSESVLAIALGLYFLRVGYWIRNTGKPYLLFPEKLALRASRDESYKKWLKSKVKQAEGKEKKNDH